VANPEPLTHQMRRGLAVSRGLDPFAPLLICPGETAFVLAPGVVFGTEYPKNTQPGFARTEGPRQIWESQWAQQAMFAYYYMDFKAKHDTYGFVLSEAEYAFLQTGVAVADDFLSLLADELRRDYSQRWATAPRHPGLLPQAECVQRASGCRSTRSHYTPRDDIDLFGGCAVQTEQASASHLNRTDYAPF